MASKRDYTLDEHPESFNERHSGDVYNINIGGSAKPEPPKEKMPEIPMDIPEEPEEEFRDPGSFWKRRRALKGERARAEAIHEAKVRDAKYEKKVRDIRESAEKKLEQDIDDINTGKKKSYCERHPLVCGVGKAVATPVTAPIKAGKYTKNKLDERAKRKEAKREEDELIEYRKSSKSQNTKEFCKKHPKACKAGKYALVAGAVGTVGAIGLATGADPGDLGAGLGMVVPTPSRKKKVQQPKKSTSRAKTGTSTPKTKKAVSKPVSKPKKAKSTAKTTRSTPKKRSAKKTAKKSNDGWWGNGDAGL